jgi:peroxiredoxin
MSPSPEPSRVSTTGLLVLALIIILLAGGVLVRLVGEADPLAPAGDRSAVENASATENIGSEAPAGPPQVGTIAPDFALTDLDGQPAKLSDWRGQPVLLNFWATWCGPCEVEMPTIQTAYQHHQDDGLVVLAVAVDDSVTNVQRFFEKHNLTIKPLVDDGTASRVFQVFGLPTSYFIGPDGKIAAVHTGLLTENTIEEYLAKTQVIAGD